MRSGRVSVFIVFTLNGVIAGSWAPRMPTLAEQIGANPGVLGLALLGAPVGLVTAASFAGQWCARFGARAVVLVSALVAAGVLPVLAIVTSPWQLGLVLVVLGASFGVFDVSMNVAAVTVIRRVERPLMPVFHAGFSFGALAGSLIAAFAAGHRVDLLLYFAVVTIASLAVTAGVIRFVPREEPGADTGGRGGRDRGMLRRPVLWLLGGVAFCSAITEGSGYDWSALFAVRERGLSEAAGAVMFSVFTVAMGVVRLVGEPIQRRFGSIRILAGGEREIGFVTTIAYSGFLLGPPMVGGLAQLVDLSFAIGCVGVIAMLIAPAALAAAAARRREEQTPPAQRSGAAVAADYEERDKRGGSGQHEDRGVAD